MSKALQAKLLRALEAGEVRRIGENDSRRVDVRFVAATNVDLKAAVDAGEFRSDLYYRLNVHRIHMPPLRERAEDICACSSITFSRKYGAATGVDAVQRRRLGAARRVLLSRQRPPARAHHPARASRSPATPELDADDLPEEVVAPPSAPRAAGGHGRGRARARRPRDARGDARAPWRRDRRRRARAPGQPHDHVAADEEVRIASLERVRRFNPANMPSTFHAVKRSRASSAVTARSVRTFEPTRSTAHDDSCRLRTRVSGRGAPLALGRSDRHDVGGGCRAA